MSDILFKPKRGRESFYRWATALALITIYYNLTEGLVSVFFGYEDGAVALFGFGIDSFVEVISGLGVWHMIRRMRQNGNENHDAFEKTALRVTGTSFYLLGFGLTATALLNLYQGHKPATTLWGIIVGVISIIAMWALIHYKLKVGRLFNSRALLADAACTETCMYLSIILIVASIGYELTGIGMVDSIGAIGIAYFSFKEGHEAFKKAKGELCCCDNECKI
jgi:divalent metal cation (Fe/Co/Zn/Cd) transporter